MINVVLIIKHKSYTHVLLYEFLDLIGVVHDLPLKYAPVDFRGGQEESPVIREEAARDCELVI